MFRPAASALRTASRARHAQPVAAARPRWASTAAAAPAAQKSGATEVPADIISASQLPVPDGQEVDPQLNGYPQLPYISMQHRAPLGWWDVQERKNYNEVIHEEEDVLGMWGPDYHKIRGSTAFFAIAGVLTAIAGFGYVLSFNLPERPFARRSYPYNGLEKELGGYVAARPEEDEINE